MSLYDLTKDLHHDCERHAVGQRMSDGTVTPQEWADWLGAFRVLHTVADAAVPEHMARDGLLAADLSALPRPHASPAAYRFAADLAGADLVAGAAYVLHGAHRSGGRVLAPRIIKRGLPCAHVSYRDQTAAKAWLATVREDRTLAEQARATFGCLLAVMAEIEGRHD